MLYLAEKYKEQPATCADVPWGAGVGLPFALQLFAGQLARAANGFGLLTRFFLGRLFEMLLELHFPKNPFALEFFLKHSEGLIDIVVAYTDLHVVCTMLKVDGWHIDRNRKNSNPMYRFDGGKS